MKNNIVAFLTSFFFCINQSLSNSLENNDIEVENFKNVKEKYFYIAPEKYFNYYNSDYSLQLFDISGNLGYFNIFLPLINLNGEEENNFLTFFELVPEVYTTLNENRKFYLNKKLCVNLKFVNYEEENLYDNFFYEFFSEKYYEIEISFFNLSNNFTTRYKTNSFIQLFNNDLQFCIYNATNDMITPVIDGSFSISISSYKDDLISKTIIIDGPFK